MAAELLGSTPPDDLETFYIEHKIYAMVPNMIACIICITLAIFVLLHRKWVQPNMISIHWLNSTSILFFSIACALLTAAAAENNYNKKFQAFQFAYGLFWVIAASLCYILYIQRLKLAFTGTQYAVNTQQLRAFYASVSLFFIGHIIIWGIVGLFYNTSRFNTNKMFLADAGLYFILIILDLIVSGILIYLFIHKLVHVMAQFNDENNFKMNELKITKSGSNYKLTDSQMSIVNVMTKSFVLSLFVILSTQISLISNCVLYLMVGYRNDKIFFVFYIIQTIISAINCTMSSVCIYLNNEYGQKGYDKLCGKIDTYFQMLFKKYSQNTMIKVLEQNHYKQLAEDDAMYKNPTDVDSTL